MNVGMEREDELRSEIDKCLEYMGVQQDNKTTLGQALVQQTRPDDRTRETSSYTQDCPWKRCIGPHS